MKRAGVALVLASALAGTFAQTSAPASAAMPTLTLGRSEQVGPRTPMAEVGVRLVGELGRRAGVAFDFKPLPATRSLEAANAGEIDGNVGRTIDVLRRYPNLMAVPTPLGRLTMAIYGQTPDIATKSRAEIARMRVGVMRGVLTALKHSQGMQVNESTSFDSAFEMLASGHVDALLLEHVSAESYLKAHPNRRVHLWPHA